MSELMLGHGDEDVEDFVNEVDDVDDDSTQELALTEAEENDLLRVMDRRSMRRCVTDTEAPEPDSAPLTLSPSDPLAADDFAPSTDEEDDETGFALRTRNSTVTIPVYVHVIRTGRKASQGNLSTSRIKSQIRVLNRSFAGKTGGVKTRFQFKLRAIDRTTSSKWYRAEPMGRTEKKMKQMLHRGSDRALNVYFRKMRNFDGTIGWSTFPWNKRRAYDGVVIDNATLPGSSSRYFGAGDTLVHEAGHWFGLYHTFEEGGDGNGCTGKGDRVSDTTPEAWAAPSDECNLKRNTCPGGGNDPIRNFMDYSPDTCMREFTKGQARRALAGFRKYRN